MDVATRNRLIYLGKDGAGREWYEDPETHKRYWAHPHGGRHHLHLASPKMQNPSLLR
jgi:hypothetical protein